MNPGFIMRARKITSLIVVSSIIGLSLVSLLPWISDESGSADGAVYLNMGAIEKSNNEQIKGLANDLGLINTYFWLVIIFGLLSFVGITIYVSGKYSSLAQIIMLIGCTTIIFNILIIFYHYILLENIENMESISAPSIFAFVGYAHLPLAMGAISLIGSIAYTGFAVSFSIKNLINSKKQRRDKKTKEKQFSKKEEHVPIKETYEEKKELPRQIQTKPVELEKKIPSENLSMQEEYSEPRQEQPSELEKPVALKQPFTPEEPSVKEETHEKLPVAEEPPSKPETISETVKEQSRESEEPPVTSPLFEKALSSAVEKKQIKTNKADVDKNQRPVKEKTTVRCPQCENIFTVEKGEDVTKIECPRCGKKGIAK